MFELAARLLLLIDESRCFAGTELLPLWRRQYFWLLPKPHHLCSSFTDSGAGATFDMDLDKPALAYLWEHQVREVSVIVSHLQMTHCAQFKSRNCPTIIPGLQLVHCCKRMGCPYFEAPPSLQPRKHLQLTKACITSLPDASLC